MGRVVMTPSEIRAVRDRLGVTQHEFSQLLNVARSTVAQWEAGRTEPSELQADLIREYDRRARERQSDKFVKRLLALAAGGAFGALLSKLFSDSDES